MQYPNAPPSANNLLKKPIFSCWDGSIKCNWPAKADSLCSEGCAVLDFCDRLELLMRGSRVKWPCCGLSAPERMMLAM